MSGPLGARRAPLADVGPHPVLEPRPAGAVWIRDGDVPDVEGATCLCIAPGRWWLVIDGDVPARPAHVTDVSHGITRLRVRGPHAEAVLSSGVSLDLHPRVFTVGTAAATAYRSIFVVLHRTDGDVFDVYTPRSTASSLWEWLVDAAAGCPPT